MPYKNVGERLGGALTRLGQAYPGYAMEREQQRALGAYRDRVQNRLDEQMAMDQQQQQALQDYRDQQVAMDQQRLAMDQQQAEQRASQQKPPSLDELYVLGQLDPDAAQRYEKMKKLGDFGKAAKPKPADVREKRNQVLGEADRYAISRGATLPDGAPIVAKSQYDLNALEAFDRKNPPLGVPFDPGPMDWSGPVNLAPSSSFIQQYNQPFAPEPGTFRLGAPQGQPTQMPADQTRDITPEQALEELRRRGIIQ